MEILFSSRRWTNHTFWKRSGPENIHFDTGTPNSRRRWQRFSGRIRRVSSTTSRLTSGCRWSDEWFLVMSGNIMYRHHVEPRVKLYSPREELFPIPLKYIDVSRTTHTNLDVMQESRIDDYWNIDGSRDLSDSWTGFTQFTLLEKKPPDGKMWSGGRLTRKQLKSRPDHLWPELWKTMGRNAKLKERQKWSHEKPKLDNAWKLRGIYFIDHEDKEFKETIKNMEGGFQLKVQVEEERIGETHEKEQGEEQRVKERTTAQRGWPCGWHEARSCRQLSQCVVQHITQHAHCAQKKWRVRCTVYSYCYLRNIQDLLSDGTTPYERRFGVPFHGPVLPFGAMVEYQRVSAKDRSRLHQFGPKILPGIFFGYVLYAGGIWKGDIMVADIEELEEIDASEVRA